MRCVAWCSWTPLGLPAFLFVITLVVFFHELGHFLVARAFGVKVDVFSVGFGKEIFGRTDKHGTRWKVSWLPIGGYVKFAGDANAASAPDRDRRLAHERGGTGPRTPRLQAARSARPGCGGRTFRQFHPRHCASDRAVPVSPAMPSSIRSSARVTKRSPAQEAGIFPGDRVPRIDGKPITDFQQLPEIISLSGGETLTMDLQPRRPCRSPLHVVPRPMRTADVLGNMGQQVVIGVRPPRNATVTIDIMARRGHSAPPAPRAGISSAPPWSESIKWCRAMPAPTSFGARSESPR